MIRVRLSWVLISVFVCASCLDAPDCIATSTNLVKITFKNAEGVNQAIAIDSILVSGIDFPLYAGDSLASIQLPVQPDQNQAVFEVYFNERTEFILLLYARNVQVISPDCGAFVNYTDLTVPDFSFEQIDIITDRLLTNATVNLEVYIE